MSLVQGQAVSLHLAVEQSMRGGPERDEVSQAGKQGSVMPYKGIWISFLAGGGCKQEWRWERDEISGAAVGRRIKAE